MTDEVVWPVVVVSTDDRFLHIATDEADLYRHAREDAKARELWPDEPGEVVLECFDSTGRRLRPVLGTAWLPRGFAPTDATIDPAELVRRMLAAAGHAERWQRLQRQLAAEAAGVPSEKAKTRALEESPLAPTPAGPEIAAYALALRTEMHRAPVTVGPPGDIDQGGWLHNAWHAAFG